MGFIKNIFKPKNYMRPLEIWNEAFPSGDEAILIESGIQGEKYAQFRICRICGHLIFVDYMTTHHKSHL